MNFETIQYDEQDFVGTITINRPAAMNALNNQVMEELGGLLDKLKSSSLRALIITGSGEKSFVAGADIKEMENMGPEEAFALSKRGQSVFRLIEHLPFATLAAVNGFALGGGFELALSCDFIFASQKAKFALPEVGLGLIPGYGGTQRLSRSVGLNHARRICLSGDIFTADQMLSFGAVTQVCPGEELISEANKVAQSIAAKGPIAVTLAKQVVLNGFDMSLDEGLQLEAEMFSKVFQSMDKKEGVSAFIQKRAPQFKGQ